MVRRPHIRREDAPLHPLSMDVFDGFFDDGRHPDPAPGSLLDIDGARQWLDLVGWGANTGLYTYQLPLEGCCGPRVTVGGRSLLMLSAYDYLGLSGHPSIQRAAIEAVERFGTGTGGVRLLTGTTELHRDLEAELAAFKGTEAALAFTSGYMATLAVVSALLGPSDRVILDERAHRSTIDACMLARVPFRRFRHNDVDFLARELRRTPPTGRTLVVVEGIYSMDGDTCPLAEIVDVVRAHGAFIMVDEAHSFGILGASGRGIDEHTGVSPTDVDIWMGSLSKAVPSNGGFLAGKRELIIYLQHGAAPFMFSSALCPAAVGAACASLDVLKREPWRIAVAEANAVHLRDGLVSLGYDVGNSTTCIIPVVVGSNEAAFRLSRDLLDLGILASAVIPPAVPAGASRLRLCATAAQTRTDLDEALSAFERLVGGHCTERLPPTEARSA